MAKDALKKIVRAAASTKNVKSVFANNPYFSYCEDREWGHTTSFLRTNNYSLKKSQKKQ
mgnify:CR=1 FL=1